MGTANPKEWSWDQLFERRARSTIATAGSRGTTRSCRRATSSSATSRIPTKRIVALAGHRRAPPDARRRADHARAVAAGRERADLGRARRRRRLAGQRADPVPQPGHAVRADARRGRLPALVADGARSRASRLHRRGPTDAVGHADPGDLPPLVHLRGLRRGLQAAADGHRRSSSSRWTDGVFKRVCRGRAAEARRAIPAAHRRDQPRQHPEDLRRAHHAARDGQARPDRRRCRRAARRSACRRTSTSSAR